MTFKSGPVTQRVTASCEKRRSQEKTKRQGVEMDYQIHHGQNPGHFLIPALFKTKDKNNISKKTVQWY